MTHRQFRALFGEFTAPSWRAWASVEDALFGVEPEDPELVRRLTGRTVLPSSPVAEGWLIVGRGAGKSRIAARLACYFACGREYRRVPGESIFVGVFAPDRKQAALTFRYIRGLLRSVPALAALIVRETTETIELSNGIVIEVITASAAAPRGRAYVVVVGEEFAHHGGDTDLELLRAVRPALARVPGSLLLVISSPYAMRGELYRVWRERFGKDDDTVLVVQADTATLNPSFSSREIERAYAEDPASAGAEYGGQFRKDIADLFGPALDGAVDEGVSERAPEHGRIAFAHFDGATGSGEDDAALAIAWPDDDGRGVLAVLRRWSPPFSAVAVVREAALLLARYRVDSVQIDRFAPGLFADLFAGNGIACDVAERDTSATFLELLAYVNADRVRLLDDDVLLGQLRGLERRTRDGGRDAVGHRPRGHDDIAAAAAGALILAASDDADGPPLALVGGSVYREWETRRAPAASAPASAAERAELLARFAPFCLALEDGDEVAAERATKSLEAYIAGLERTDVDAGTRVRALAQRVQDAITRVRATA